MIPVLLFVAIIAQGALTGKDVGSIVTASVNELSAFTEKGDRAPRARQLIVDIAASNKAFNVFAGRTIPVDSTAWLPGRAHLRAPASSALSCDVPGEIDNSCRVLGDGAFLQVRTVKRSQTPGELEIRLMMLWNETVGGATVLAGFDATLAVRKSGDGWQARLVKAAVGD